MELRKIKSKNRNWNHSARQNSWQIHFWFLFLLTDDAIGDLIRFSVVATCRGGEINVLPDAFFHAIRVKLCLAVMTKSLMDSELLPLPLLASTSGMVI